MKMIIAIVDDTIQGEISKKLLEENYRVTQLATTSRFLRGGATTLMVGVENELVENALSIIRKSIPEPTDPKKNQATLYVLNVKNFNRI
jgi:uncharacterized protein YaaQ